MQMLKEKIPSNFFFHLLICQAFAKQNMDDEKVITHPQTLIRRAKTPFEDLTDNELLVFCPVLKAKVQDIRNPEIIFVFDGKKWVKQMKGGHEA
jgi:hypothetical protein